MLTANQVHSSTAELCVPPLHAAAGGNSVFARQIACGHPVDGERVPVNAPNADPLPPIVGDCGDHLQATRVTPGAHVEFFIDDRFWQGRWSCSSSVYLDLTQPLPNGTRLKARQIACTHVSGFGNEVQIRNDVEKRRLDWITTERVCQLTGDNDPEGKPMVNSSAAAGISGTDLGVVLDHDTGDGFLYLFFGDTDGVPSVMDKYKNKYPRAWDCIARTSASAAGPNGPTLEFLHDLEDDEASPHIFGIHLVRQEDFEVPTGGFSHAGKLYVFASTDHPNTQPPVMGRSVLAAAAEAHEMFHVVAGHEDISNINRDPSGGFKFINIAAQKTRNDDWLYLPDNAAPGGEGLILIGSGRYRASQPCLAYVPLASGQEPVFAEWRYFSGFAGPPSADQLCGVPQWSSEQSAATFLFDDAKTPGTIGNPGVVGELSITYVPQIRLWIFLYSVEMHPPETDGGMMLRSARYPWGPWSEPIQLFNFVRDQGNKFMPWATAYAPYVIARFTEFDQFTRELTIYWNMSTWDPYQVMLMRTVLREDCSYNNNYHCPLGGAVTAPPT